MKNNRNDQTWFVVKILSRHNSESEALQDREALCGLNQRSDYIVLDLKPSPFTKPGFLPGSITSKASE